MGITKGHGSQILVPASLCTAKQFREKAMYDLTDPKDARGVQCTWAGYHSSIVFCTRQSTHCCVGASRTCKSPQFSACRSYYHQISIQSGSQQMTEMEHSLPGAFLDAPGLAKQRILERELNAPATPNAAINLRIWCFFGIRKSMRMGVPGVDSWS